MSDRPTVLERPRLTTEELLRASQWLHGLATATARQGGVSLVLPVRTAHRLADALLEAVNRAA